MSIWFWYSEVFRASVDRTSAVSRKDFSCSANRLMSSVSSSCCAFMSPILSVSFPASCVSSVDKRSAALVICCDWDANVLPCLSIWSSVLEKRWELSSRASFVRCIAPEAPLRALPASIKLLVTDLSSCGNGSSASLVRWISSALAMMASSLSLRALTRSVRAVDLLLM